MTIGALAFGVDFPIGEQKVTESDESRKRRLDRAKEEQNKAKGLKKFFYGENNLWALNQKSADKKARKLKWI